MEQYIMLIVIVVVFGGMMWWQSKKAKQQQQERRTEKIPDPMACNAIWLPRSTCHMQLRHRISPELPPHEGIRSTSQRCANADTS